LKHKLKSLIPSAATDSKVHVNVKIKIDLCWRKLYARPYFKVSWGWFVMKTYFDWGRDFAPLPYFMSRAEDVIVQSIAFSTN